MDKTSRGTIHKAEVTAQNPTQGSALKLGIITISPNTDRFLSNDWDEFEDKIDKLGEFNHTLDGSKAILKQLGYSDSEIGEICRWFELNGGYCDCEVVMNVVMKKELLGQE